MKLFIVALLLTLSVSAHADSMKGLIEIKAKKLDADNVTKVYEVSWNSGNRVEKSGVNAHSIEQVIRTMKEQMNVSDKDIIRVEVKK